MDLSNLIIHTNMKLKVVILTLASAIYCYSASIDVTNFGGSSSDVVITDNTGVPIANVFSYILTLSGEVPTSIESLRTLNPQLLSVNNDAAGIVPGGFSNSFSGEGNNENIYVLFMDAADIASSSQFGLVSTGEVFNLEVPPAIDSNNYLLGDPKGAALIGQFGGAATTSVDWTDTTGIDSVGSATFRLVAIPEPSAALLAGLALVGGLVRRRR